MIELDLVYPIFKMWRSGSNAERAIDMLVINIF